MCEQHEVVAREVQRPGADGEPPTGRRRTYVSSLLYAALLLLVSACGGGRGGTTGDPGGNPPPEEATLLLGAASVQPFGFIDIAGIPASLLGSPATVRFRGPEGFLVEQQVELQEPLRVAAPFFLDTLAGLVTEGDVTVEVEVPGVFAGHADATLRIRDLPPNSRELGSNTLDGIDTLLDSMPWTSLMVQALLDIPENSGRIDPEFPLLLDDTVDRLTTLREAVRSVAAGEVASLVLGSTPTGDGETDVVLDAGSLELLDRMFLALASSVRAEVEADEGLSKPTAPSAGSRRASLIHDAVSWFKDRMRLPAGAADDLAMTGVTTILVGAVAVTAGVAIALIPAVAAGVVVAGAATAVIGAMVIHSVLQGFNNFGMQAVEHAWAHTQPAGGGTSAAYGELASQQCAAQDKPSPGNHLAIDAGRATTTVTSVGTPVSDDFAALVASREAGDAYLSQFRQSASCGQLTPSALETPLSSFGAYPATDIAPGQTPQPGGCVSSSRTMDVYARPDGTGSMTLEYGTTCLGNGPDDMPQTSYQRIVLPLGDRQQPCISFSSPAILWCAFPRANLWLIVYEDGRATLTSFNGNNGTSIQEQFGR